MTWKGIVLIVIGILALTFAIDWVLVKGIIWAINQIWEKDLSDKFWAVFIILFIVQCIFGGNKVKSK